MLSELNALDGDRTSSLSTATLFLSNEKTPFGDWVKAGALKAGDTVSTLSSITSQGPTLQRAVKLSAANDNAVSEKSELKDQLTVEDLRRLGVKVPANDNGHLGNALFQKLTVTSTRNLQRAIRVYNLEIESRPGEITHNYLVGDELVWVHNAGHKKGKRPSTRGKHSKGDARRCLDVGNEEGDKRRERYRNYTKPIPPKPPRPGHEDFVGPVLPWWKR